MGSWGSFIYDNFTWHHLTLPQLGVGLRWCFTFHHGKITIHIFMHILYIYYTCTYRPYRYTYIMGQYVLELFPELFKLVWLLNNSILSKENHYTILSWNLSAFAYSTGPCYFSKFSPTKHACANDRQRSKRLRRAKMLLPRRQKSWRTGAVKLWGSCFIEGLSRSNS